MFLVFVLAVACKQSCERHDIGTQCGATATNTTAQTTKNSDANSNQQNQKKFSKKRQLEVVSSPADGYQNQPAQPAAFVPSKVPRWRTPPYLNILIPEHHITPHMIKVNAMAKLNTVPDTALNDIEKFLDI